ncbi:MAG: tetratricopeptide repeat protein [Candidatus Kapaibacterium sp.]
MEAGWNTLQIGVENYPQYTVFRYEQAYIRSVQERYAEVIKIMEEIIDAPDSFDRYYQMLGNAYDLSGNPKKAIETYEKGLQKYPKSGRMYLELGVVFAKEEDYDKAMEYWEKGLTVDPNFSSNYLRAAVMYMATTERGWGQIYGEIFIHLEFNSERAMGMRQILWESYNEAIVLAMEQDVDNDNRNDDLATSDSKRIGEFKFFQNANLELDSESGQLLLPFTMFFERAASMASIPLIFGGQPLTVANLHKFRSDFLDQWYQDTAAAEHFDMSLYSYQRRLKNAGLFEAFDYYLFFCEETADEVIEWFEKNPGKQEELQNWLSKNPYQFRQKTPFSRLNLKGISIDTSDLIKRFDVEVGK